MNKDNGNKPIYPVTRKVYRVGHEMEFTTTVLTKREHFAALAMQGLISISFDSPAKTAARAVEMAEALLAELEKTTP